MMRYRTPGFTLLELIVGLAVSSLLAVILFATYLQSQRSVLRTNEVMDKDFQLMVVYHQFMRDFSGMFVPVTFEEQKQPEAQEGAQQQPPKKLGDEAKKRDTPPKLKVVPIKQPLVVERDGNNIANISFVTNNPLLVYGQDAPRIVRIAYRLEADPRRAEAFVLYRKESLIVDYAAFREEQPYEYMISDNIRRFSIDFYAVKEDKEAKEREAKRPKSPFEAGGSMQQPQKKPAQQGEGKEKQQPGDKPRILEFVQLPDWNEEELKANEEIQKDTLPYAVRIKVDLWDQDFERSQEHTFYYRIWAYESGIIKQPPTQMLPTQTPSDKEKTDKKEDKKDQKAPPGEAKDQKQPGKPPAVRGQEPAEQKPPETP